MSISFQSTSASSGSRNDTKARLMQQQQQQLQQSPHIIGATPPPGAVPIHGHQHHLHHQHHPQQQTGQHPSFLGGIFHKRERKLSKSDDCGVGGPFGRSTEV